MALQRVMVAWSGFPGGPGVSVLHFNDAVAAKPALKTFYTALITLLPNNVTVTIPNSGDTIDSGTGQITGAWSGGTTDAIVGTGSSTSYAAASGASVIWATSTIFNGRRLKGRTYLVPLASQAYDAGSLTSTAITTIQNAATALVGTVGVEMQVFHRPGPVGSGKLGGQALVTSALVRDKQATLRSRRD